MSKRLFSTIASVAACVAIAQTTRAADGLSLDPFATKTVLTLDDAAPAAAAQPALPRLVPVVDYSGDFWQRPALTGDWGGARSQLSEKGVRAELTVTQVYQRNFAGGLDNGPTYMGRADLSIKVDTTYAGLWPGGLLSLRAEGRWGQSHLEDDGSLMPVNAAAIFPQGNKNVFALPEFNYTQFLAPFIGVTFGKYGPRDANIFASNANEQFLNAAFNFNPVIGTTLPLSFLGAGFIVIPFPELIITNLVLDTEGRGDTTGFNTVFDGGTSTMQLFDLSVKPFGLPGHQRIGWTWTDKQRTILDQNARDILGAIISGSTSGLPRQSGDWAVFYDFDQYIYLVEGSTDRGLGIFARVGFDDGSVNPVEQFYSFGISGKGLIPGREKDSFGIAYYYLKLSGDLPTFIKNRTQDEQGFEAYYNIAITPWLRLTPDIQIINPANSSLGTSYVAGFRLEMRF